MRKRIKRRAEKTIQLTKPNQNKREMKRITMIIVALIAITASASAMSYKSAREQALFLTDKMAYELNLTDDQYNAAYEINLDYLMNMSTSGDLYGSFWTWRNQELSYVLSSAQYATYLATTYFYRPLSWVSNRFSLLIYGHYPKGRYFRSAPPVYHTYRGGNRIYQHSPYKGRTFGDYKNIQPRVTNRPAGNQPKGGQ